MELLLERLVPLPDLLSALLQRSELVQVQLDDPADEHRRLGPVLRGERGGGWRRRERGDVLVSTIKINFPAFKNYTKIS